MKKYKCVIINILIMFVLLIIFEFLCFISFSINFSEIFNKYTLKQCSYDDTYNDFIKNNFREVSNKYSKNKPILLLGCSFAYGHNLDATETFGFKLAKYTDRPVYNRAFDYGWGFHNAYYMFQREDFYQELPKIDTIIYVFIDDHINRAKGIYMDDLKEKEYEALRYNIKDNQLFQYSFRSKNPLLNLNFIKLFKKYIFLHQYKNKKFNEITFSEKFFLEIRKKAEERWGGGKMDKKIQFVILNYSNNNNELMDKLKEDGFQVINLKDLTDKDLLTSEYQIQFNDDHPNGKAWDIIVPSLIRKLAL